MELVLSFHLYMGFEDETQVLVRLVFYELLAVKSSQHFFLKKQGLALH